VCGSFEPSRNNFDLDALGAAPNQATDLYCSYNATRRTAPGQDIHDPMIVGWQATNHTVKMRDVNDASFFQKLNLSASM
jgi:hypothetical protein